MRAAATDVEEKVIPASGHWLMEEQPVVTVAAVRAFLDRQRCAGEPHTPRGPQANRGSVRPNLRDPRRRVSVGREAVCFLGKFAKACDPDFVSVPVLEYLMYCVVHRRGSIWHGREGQGHRVVPCVIIPQPRRRRTIRDLFTPVIFPAVRARVLVAKLTSSPSPKRPVQHLECSSATILWQHTLRVLCKSDDPCYSTGMSDALKSRRHSSQLVTWASISRRKARRLVCP
jgi:hypothetical protein